MHGVDPAVRGAGGRGGPHGGGRRAEAGLLALHIDRGLDVSRDQGRDRTGLGGIDGGRGAEHEQGHDSDQRPAVPLGQHGAAKGDDAGVPEHVHGYNFHEVGPGVGVLEGVSRVGVEHPAAIGAQLLNGFLAGRGEQGDGLFGALDRVGDHPSRQGLGHAQGHIGQGDQNAEGQQDVEADPGQIDPEIAQALGPVSSKGPRHHGGDSNAAGSGQEVVRGQTRHLAEGRHGRLRYIGLPVSVGDEADCCIER